MKGVVGINVDIGQWHNFSWVRQKSLAGDHKVLKHHLKVNGFCSHG